MKSIYLRHFLTTSLMILLSFLVLGSSFLALTFQYISAEREAQLDSIAYYLADYSANFVFETSKGESLAFTSSSYQLYAAGLRVLGGVTNVEALAVTGDGTVVACSDGVTCSHLGMTLPEEIMKILQAQGSFQGVRAVEKLGSGPVMLVGRPIRSASGNVVGAVFSAMPVSDINALLHTFFRFFMIAALVVLLISGLLASYVSRKLTRPLTHIAQAARAFALGRFDTRIPVRASRQDEIGQLAQAFNAMAESMEKSEQLRRDFIANVSHELRTPMTSIAGYVDGILDGTIPPTRQTYYLTVIRDEVHRMNRLVVTMLEIARMQSGNMTLELTNFDICEQCSRTALNLEERITEKNLDMRLDFPKDAVMVRADRDKITQVVSNLLDNAVKFATPGTPLSLRVAPHGDKARVSVSNDGPEISPEDLPHVFDRFHKADRSRGRDKGGLGLGLYIVKTILAGHGETIWVESREGRTTFTFTLKLDDSKLKMSQKPTLRQHGLPPADAAEQGKEDNNP